MATSGGPPVPDPLDERLAVAARALARADGVPVDVLDRDPWLAGRDDRRDPDLEDRPDALGRLHQRLLPRERRLADGVFHTPVEVGRVLVDLALDELGRVPGRAVDPAAGGGALLLAAADALVARGVPAAEAFGALRGIEIDPLAADVASATLRRWAWRHGLGWPSAPVVVVGDGLAIVAAQRADLVVANPPFGGRVRGPARAVMPTSGGAYADVVVEFLVAADALLGPGGVLASFCPSSVLASRDAASVRARLSERRRLAVVWADPPPFEGVAIVPCAVVLGPPGGSTTVVRGDRRRRVEPPGDRWGVAASAVPETDGLATEGTLGDLAEIAAPFRDEFYALAPAVVEDGGGPAVLTSGLIDPARSLWTDRPARIAGRTLERPTLDPDRVEGAGRRWLERTARPKVLVASQTRRIEAVADVDGRLVGLTPVVSVVPTDGDVHRLLAVLCSPLATAWVLRLGTGTGLSREAVRVSGRTLSSVPLPARSRAWGQAAGLLAADGAAALQEVERLMSVAYGIDEGHPLSMWWRDVGPATARG